MNRRCWGVGSNVGVVADHKSEGASASGGDMVVSQRYVVRGGCTDCMD